MIPLAHPLQVHYKVKKNIKKYQMMKNRTQHALHLAVKQNQLLRKNQIKIYGVVYITGQINQSTKIFKIP
jgi:hypothetical protein